MEGKGVPSRSQELQGSPGVKRYEFSLRNRLSLEGSDFDVTGSLPSHSSENLWFGMDACHSMSSRFALGMF